MRTIFTSTLLLLVAAAARGDTVWVNSAGGSGGNALEFPRVQINDIKGGKLVFVGASGRESSRDVSQVARIQVDAEPTLSAAEDAAAKGQWDVATDAYRKVIASSGKPWAKLYAAQRLIPVAQKANRFDAAATAYIAVVLADPAQAGRGPAAILKLAIPDERSTYLTSALSEVTAALADPKLTPPQRKALLSLQLDLQRARKDQKGADQTMEKLLQTGAGSGSDPNAAAALAKLKLDQASLTLDKKDFQKVIADIKANAAVFTDPKDQAEALFLLAEAQAGLAATQAGQTATTAWQDAALAYLRVVAHFRDNPAAAGRVTQSMFKAAQIEEKLNDRDGARLLYEQLAAQFPSDPAAPQAKAAAERLKANR